MAADNVQHGSVDHDVKFANAPTLGTLTDTQRKALYAKLRTQMGKQHLAVEGKPGIHYFWADKGDTSEIIRLEGLGYEIVREPSAKDVLAGKVKPSISASGLHADGTYWRGDVILMQCPMEVYEFIMLDIDERHELSRSAPVDTFRSEAANKGVPTFEPRSVKGS